jgi:hypothetical protein
MCIYKWWKANHTHNLIKGNVLLLAEHNRPYCNIQTSSLTPIYSSLYIFIELKFVFIRMEFNFKSNLPLTEI